MFPDAKKLFRGSDKTFFSGKYFFSYSKEKNLIARKKLVLRQDKNFVKSSVED